MKNTAIIILNVLTGCFTVLNSLVAYGISGMGEGSTNRLIFLIWIAVWALGFFLQLMGRTKVIGLVITFIPVMYFVYIYIAAYLM